MNKGIIKRIAYIERERIRKEILRKREHELSQAICKNLKCDQIIFIKKEQKK